jgi:hypothetical protein
MSCADFCTQKFKACLETATRQVKQCKEENVPDLAAWKWLQSVIEHLDKDSMSFNESNNNGSGELESFRLGLHIKKMP